MEKPNYIDSSEIPAAIYTATVVNIQAYPETTSVNVIYKVGDATLRTVTFINDGELRGASFETICALAEGQLVRFQNSSLSNVPEKIWVI